MSNFDFLQKEWRLLDDANQKIRAPKINAIYIGEKASKENKEKLIEFCKKRSIVIKD